jgi:hypothetical protein
MGDHVNTQEPETLDEFLIFEASIVTVELESEVAVQLDQASKHIKHKDCFTGAARGMKSRPGHNRQSIGLLSYRVGRNRRPGPNDVHIRVISTAEVRDCPTSSNDGHTAPQRVKNVLSLIIVDIVSVVYVKHDWPIVEGRAVQRMPRHLHQDEIRAQNLDDPQSLPEAQVWVTGIGVPAELA